MSDALPGKARDFVVSHLKEAIKSYYAYDGSNRLEYAYTAHPDAEHGDACLGTQYAYDGATDRVQKSKEFLTTWDSSWDI